ncbi:MAG: (2Fe-2S) ferredoxin domain-containing protein [Firmicutes bacterium]|jgi:NADH:ubiquinone oxidoreductase subunit E|nr:(2Fe-2S) ferredoxin domain-containing protein [Bacillota bacterium]MDD4336398.1 (2Fe-2S) ferredoxin domain-containing protein [Bacillota bacterium]MDD4793488.1 (2Fe-2S) ferredoxin domain-containing protein [Bacillota bacterium]
MVTISVCVGSSCHIKGAPEVIEKLQKLIAEHDLYNQVELKGVFCLERCTEGVTIAVDGEIYSAMNPDGVVEIFSEHVLEPLGVAVKAGDGQDDQER